jgi:hypothetical protein
MAEEKGLFESISDQLSITESDPLPRRVGAFDYVTDIPLGLVKGVSQAIQGLIGLGALPIDYAFDTNLTSKIDSLFEKITPETDTVVGDITSVLGQFGLPAGVAVKVANGMLKLSKASQLKKLSSFKKADGSYDIAGAGGELAKRAGYYGSIGAVTDFAVSTPGDLPTFSETFGFGEAYKGKELKGRDRAIEDFKEKIRFGAEGALLGGGVVTALPVAGTLGFKYGIVPAGKYIVKPVGQAAFKTADALVFNPIGKLASTELVGKGTQAAGEFIGNQTKTLRSKLGLSEPGSWRKLSDSPNAPLLDYFKRKLDKVKNLFTDPLDDATAQEAREVVQYADADRKNIARFIKDIDSKFKDIANNQAIKLPKYLRDSKIQYPSKIMDKSDVMYGKMNDDMFDYLKAPVGMDKGLLNNLDESVRESASALKNLVVKLNNQYGRILADSGDKSLEALAAEITKNGGAYLKQTFSAMKNKAFEPNEEFLKKATKYFKEKVIPRSDEYSRIVTDKMAKDNISRSEAVDFVADSILGDLKNTLIQSNRSPESLFRTVTQTFKIPTAEAKLGVDSLLEAGVPIQDLMRSTLKTEADAIIGAYLTPTKSYQDAVVDTVMTATKQIYQKDFFDRTAKTGLERGFLFRSRAEAAAKGYKNADTMVPVAKDFTPGPTYTVFDSDMFNAGIRIGEAGAELPGPLYALPEIANAIRGQDEYLTKLFDLPGYKALMSVKAAGQVGKTVFSPMTQIRNVSTASFFALASGLIGGRASLTDAFKLLADDLFPGKFIKVGDVAKKMEDLIRRGVVDQNIEVNEIKNILDKAKKGNFTLQALIENPIVKRAFDLYQGGDNVWKIYADKFYQSALKDAFSYVSPQQARAGISGDRAIRENMIDWYRTIAKQNDIADELASLNNRINNAKTANEAAGLSQQFNNLRSVGDVSSYLVTNTIPTYSRVPKIIKNIRNLPLGNFIAFPAEILRTGTHLITIGGRELMSANPFIRQMGARRLLGAASVFGGTGAIVAGTAEKLTGVSDEKMAAFKRSIAPDFQKNSTLIPLTAPDENGEFKYFNFSYTNPYDSLTRPINAILSAHTNGQLNDASLSEILYDSFIFDRDTNAPGALTEFITPFVSESIGAGAIADLTIRGGRTKDGKIIYYPQDDIMEILDASFGHLIGQLEPGASRSVRRVYKGVTESFNDFGTQYDGATEFAALTTGLRIETAKPLNSLPFIISSYNRDTENIRNKFSRNAYSPNIDVRGRVGFMQEYLEDSYRSQSNLFRIISDMKTIGVDEDTIEEGVSERFRNKKQTNAMMDGEYRAPNFSEERFKTLIERLEREDSIAASKVESEIEEAIDIIEDIRDEVNEEELGLNPSFISDRIKELFEIPSVPTRGIISDQVAQKIELPADPNLANAPSSQIIAQTKKPITLTELERSPIFSLLRNRGIA